MSQFFIILGLLLFNTAVMSAVLDSKGQQQAYDYLNQLRSRADMIEFSSVELLNQSAQNHALYLIDNHIAGHFEREGDTGFTGITPSDRARFVNFSNISVSENVAVGQKTPFIAVDGLMGSIYHRFGFLSFSHDSIGLAVARETLSKGVSGAYTFETANTGITALCQRPETAEEFGRFLVQICHPDIKIEEGIYTLAQTAIQGKNPIIVQWPVKQATDIPPVFFEETPDPLPDLSVSGYPISVQFNPLSFSDIVVNEFRLFELSSGKEITNTRLLDQKTDPNQSFSALQFALFPLERLDWHTQYRVVFTYTHGSEAQQTLDWTFTTRDLNMPVFITQADGENIKIPRNQAGKFALYIPPTKDFSKIGQIQWSGNATQVDFIDGNTLQVSLSTDLNNQSNFSLSGGRSFSLQVAERVIKNENTPPQARFTVTPEQGQAPLTITLDGRASFDKEGAIKTYEWTAQLSDKQAAPILTASGSQAELTLTESGLYLLNLTVTDEQGLTHHTSQTLSVEQSTNDASTVLLPTLSLPDLKAVYKQDDILQVVVEEQATGRNELVDLWVAVLLPSQDLIFLTATGLSMQPQATKTNIALDNNRHDLLDYKIGAGLAGDYTLYSLYIASGKSPFNDSFLSHRSNLLIKTFSIE